MVHYYEPQQDGSILEVVKDSTLAENQKELPTREELSVDNLLRAGVPLSQVPCGTLLNPTDPANMRDVAAGVMSNLPNFEMSDEN